MGSIIEVEKQHIVWRVHTQRANAEHSFMALHATLIHCRFNWIYRIHIYYLYGTRRNTGRSKFRVTKTVPMGITYSFDVISIIFAKAKYRHHPIYIYSESYAIRNCNTCQHVACKHCVSTFIIIVIKYNTYIVILNAGVANPPGVADTLILNK